MAGSLKLNTVGEKFSVRFASWSKSQETIDCWQEFDYRVRNRFIQAFDAMCTFGRVPESQARRIRQCAHAWEYKADVQKTCWRAGAFRESKVWYVTHFFVTDHSSRVVTREGRRVEMGICPIRS